MKFGLRLTVYIEAENDDEALDVIEHVHAAVSEVKGVVSPGSVDIIDKVEDDS